MVRWNSAGISMNKYVYRDTSMATMTAHGSKGLDVFTCTANSLLEADEQFAKSGLVFHMEQKGKKIDLPASLGAERLAFISCRWDKIPE